MKLFNEVKINNKITYNSYYIVFAIVLVLNICMFINTEKLVINTDGLALFEYLFAYPTELFNALSKYLNIPLALIFIIPLIIDYNTSILEIGLIGGRIRFNKAILQKIKISSIVSLVLFLITSFNGYYIYVKEVGGRAEIISIARLIFSLAIPLIFIISLGIFLIIIMKGNGFSVVLAVGFYLIVERTSPLILLFIYFYRDLPFEIIFLRQLMHLIVSIILLLISVSKIRKV